MRPGRFALLLAVVVGWAVLGGARSVSGAEIEILLPRPGSTILARKPLTHLILRQSGEQVRTAVWVEAGEQKIEPIRIGQAREGAIFHFQLRLVPGKNVFTIQPGARRLEFRYQPVQARLPTNLKDFDLFHREDRLPESCTPCHTLQKPAPVERLGIVGQESCATCHRSVLSKTKWEHGPLRNKQCLTCHQQSETPWRIGFPPGKVEETCFACHAQKRDWFSRKYQHGPLSLGGCTLCHDPHGEDNRYRLWAEGSLVLCVVCHSDKDLLNKDNTVPYVHGILHGPGCVACHDPHATDNRFMLKKPINALCVGCHWKLAGVERGHPVANHPVRAPRERRRQGRELTCTGCHDPHGSAYRYMLIGEMSGDAICRECHG